MEHYESAIRRKIGAGAARALNLAASEPVTINVFPDHSILGNPIQMIQPLAVDESDTTWHATAVIDEAGELGGEVDHAANFEEIQRGLAACEDEWVYMRRGLGVPGRVPRLADGTLKAARATDEVCMREHMKEWKRLMNAQPRLAVLREA